MTNYNEIIPKLIKEFLTDSNKEIIILDTEENIEHFKENLRFIVSEGDTISTVTIRYSFAKYIHNDNINFVMKKDNKEPKIYVINKTEKPTSIYYTHNTNHGSISENSTNIKNSYYNDVIENFY